MGDKQLKQEAWPLNFVSFNFMSHFCELTLPVKASWASKYNLPILNQQTVVNTEELWHHFHYDYPGISVRLQYWVHYSDGPSLILKPTETPPTSITWIDFNLPWWNQRWIPPGNSPVQQGHVSLWWLAPKQKWNAFKFLNKTAYHNFLLGIQIWTILFQPILRRIGYVFLVTNWKSFQSIHKARVEILEVEIISICRNASGSL